MSSEIDGGGAPPPGGFPPGFKGRPRLPLGPLSTNPSIPTKRGRPGTPDDKGKAAESAPRRTPGYSTAGLPQKASDPERAQRMVEARQKGQAIVQSLGEDDKASAEFGQAVKGASAKHLQSPYQPSNDMQRFATDLEYTTPAIDTPRFGAQPINEAGIKDFLSRTSFIKNAKLGGEFQSGGLTAEAVRSMLTPHGSGEPISAATQKKMLRMPEVAGNRAAQSQLKNLVKLVNEAIAPSSTTTTHPTTSENDEPALKKPRLSLQRPGVGASVQPAPNRLRSSGATLAALGSFSAAAAAGASPPASASSANAPSDAATESVQASTEDTPMQPANLLALDAQAPQPSTGPASALQAAAHPKSSIDPSDATIAALTTSHAPAEAAKTGDTDTHVEMDVTKSQQNDSNSTYAKYANMPFEMFIMTIKRENYDSLMRRLVISGDRQMMTFACAMMLGSLGVKAAQEKQMMGQFDALSQVFISAAAYAQKRKDLNDGNLDQGLKLTPLQQDQDIYPTMVNDDAKQRAVSMDANQHLIAEAARLDSTGQATHHQDFGPPGDFRLLSEGELQRLESKGPEGQRIGQQIRSRQKEMQLNNRRAMGLVYNTNAQESILRRQAARTMQNSPEGQTAAGRERISQLLSAADEFDRQNAVGGIARIIRATKRTIMAFTVINRIENFNGFMKKNEDEFKQLHQQGISIERAGAARDNTLSERMFRARNAVETQLHQWFAMSSQMYFNKTSDHDYRMSLQHTGGERYTRKVNELWQNRGPTLGGAEGTSLVDKRVALDRLVQRYGANPDTAQRQAIKEARDDVERTDKLEQDKMLHARLATTTSGFASASLVHRYQELREWFGPQATQANMERWLTTGPTKEELLEAPGLRGKYTAAEMEHVVAYGHEFTRAIGGQAVPGASNEEAVIAQKGFVNMTCKAQMTRHFDDRFEAIQKSNLPPEQKAEAVRQNEQTRDFFENHVSAWRQQPSPRAPKAIAATLTAFQSEEVRNKAGYLKMQGFRAGNSDEDIAHNLRHLTARTMPNGEDAQDGMARTAHQLACKEAAQAFMTNEANPNHEFHQLERNNSALMYLSSSQTFQTQNEELMGRISEDLGELSSVAQELGAGANEAFDSTVRAAESLNQALAQIPGR